MSRLPAFFRQNGRIKPPAAGHRIRSLVAAIDYFEANGGKVRTDGAAFCLDFRGWSHGGVSAEGLVHIANEDLRLSRSAKRVAETIAGTQPA